MLPDMSIVVQDGASFAVVDGEERPIIVWSVVHCEQEVRLVNFSLHPSGLVEHRTVAKYTARMKGDKTEVICGSFRSSEDFEKQKGGGAL